MKKIFALIFILGVASAVTFSESDFDTMLVSRSREFYLYVRQECPRHSSMSTPMEEAQEL